MLVLQGVSYRYPGAKHDVLHGISLELLPGTVTGLVGPSEGGKSTLCLVTGGLAPRVIGGRLSGAVGIDGESIVRWPMHRVCEQVVTGLQDPAAQLSLVADTVFDEVAFGAANLGLPRDEVLARTDEALVSIGIEDLAGRDPTRLSGGEQQLVVIAGLLAMRPRFLVLDEPVAHLDAAGAARVLGTLRQAANDGAAVLVAEKDTDALAPVCDMLAVIGAGNIVRQGAPADVLAIEGIGTLGVSTAESRLRQRLVEAGLDPAILEAAP